MGRSGARARRRRDPRPLPAPSPRSALITQAERGTTFVIAIDAAPLPVVGVLFISTPHLPRSRDPRARTIGYVAMGTLADERRTRDPMLSVVPSRSPRQACRRRVATREFGRNAADEIAD
jgi:hypothetical protein